MSLLSSLLFLIVLARLLGETFKRLQQPSLVGEILAGIILGPSLLNIVKASPALSGISELAMFLIILSAGLEMEFKQVLDCFKGKGLVVAICGFVIPLIAGIGVGILFDLDRMQTIFLGLCIAITALPVAIRILEGFDLLKHNVAHYTIVTAIINDISALFALGIVLNLRGNHSYGEIGIFMGLAMVKLIAFGALILLMDYLLEKAEARGLRIAWIPEKLVQIFGKEALLGILIAFVLAFGSISELLGSHFVIGAFFGALLLDRKLFLASRFSELDKSLSSISSGFLAPVFFAYLGLEFNMYSLKNLLFVGVVLLVSVVSKIVAGWVGGKLAKLEGAEPLGIGIILNGRGVMELVVADIALNHGFIGQQMFSTLVLMGVFTTFITPVMFRKFVVPHLDMNGVATNAVGASGPV